jgi:hypothetical protein
MPRASNCSRMKPAPPPRIVRPPDRASSVAYCLVDINGLRSKNGKLRTKLEATVTQLVKQSSLGRFEGHPDLVCAASRH